MNFEWYLNLFLSYRNKISEYKKAERVKTEKNRSSQLRLQSRNKFVFWHKKVRKDGSKLDDAGSKKRGERKIGRE